MNSSKMKKELFELLKEIKRVRKAHGWTIAELSEKSSVSVGEIAEIESNEEGKRFPSLLTFISLLKTLGVSEDYVLRVVLEILY